ncbi:MAG: glycine cleavage system aminomethyltransferase GcvT, partial [Cyclobacteriaceae bacterium]|nr:glycine cleavage system aminomethyltransferase GcvT [Cyclobacteriaceae bacterium]
LGAKIVSFSGYEMPVRYGSELEEHHAVRKSVGMFDVSHMGEFLVQGPKALDLIQKVSSNDASKLNVGKVQYSCMPNATGGIVDDLLVYMLKPEEYMLVVNAGNIQKDWDWIVQHNDVEAELENISDNVSLLAVQGPKAEKVIQKLTNTDLSSLSYYTFSKGNIGTITDGAIISATGYTGSGGVEIYVYNEFAGQVWDEIMKAGEEFDIKPAGLGARDTLRLEMGYALYGNDIDDTTSPIEAGLGWITKFTKDFVNTENLKKQKEDGAAKKLAGFRMEERGIPRSGYDLLNENDEIVGRVTSGSMSPSLGVGIGMGYVQSKFTSPDTELLIAIRKRKLKVKIVKPPFYKA